MDGLLIVNNFLESTKFAELYSLLKGSAQKQGINLHLKKSGELIHNIDYLKALKYDFVLFWDKDVLLAKMLEICGIAVFNSSKAIELCDNKALTAIALHSSGIPTPKTVIAPLTFEGVGYNDLDFVRDSIEKLSFPFVIKESFGSFGMQVYLAHNMDEAISIIQKIDHKPFIMQELIKTSIGKDIRVNVVGGKIVSSMLRYNPNDFRSNITNGGKSQKAELTSAQAEIAVKACHALSLDFAGVDVLFGKGGEPLICEVNSNPHFKSSLDCTGKDMSFEIIKYIEKKLQK